MEHIWIVVLPLLISGRSTLIPPAAERTASNNKLNISVNYNANRVKLLGFAHIHVPQRT